MKTEKKKRTNNKFTKEEDRALRTLVRHYGESAWDEISALMPGRNARQCHDRWVYYLSPKVNNMPWSEEEDQKLIHECYELKGKWVQIAKKFKGRTDIQIKNRWNLLKKQLFLPDIQKKPKHESEINSTEETIHEVKIKEEETEKQPEKDENKVFDKIVTIFSEYGMDNYDSIFDFI